MSSIGNHMQEAAWRARRRHKIVKAAAGEFCSAAYGTVQMADIARAAGVGKPTLYRYFRSKDELFLAVFDDALDELHGRLEAIRASDAEPAEALAEMIRALVAVLGEHLASLRLLTGDHAPVAERWRASYRAARRRIAESLRAVLERGIASGAFNPVDVDVVPSLLIGMVRGGLMGAPDVPRERFVGAMIKLLLEGGVASAPRARRGARRRA